MNLIKEEIKKIFSYRLNQVSCFALILWILAICISAMLQESIIVDMNSPRLSGKEAIALEKKEFHKRKGLLTNDLLNEYILSIKKEAKESDIHEETAKQILDDKSLISYQEIIRLINSTLRNNLNTDENTQIFKVNTPINFYSEWNKKASIDNGLHLDRTNHIKPFYYDYARGWQTIINKFDDLMLGLLIVLSICLSNVFTEDDEQNMRGILRTSKYGRKQSVASKIKASLATSTIFYLFSILIFMTVLFIEYGTTGGNVSVQIDTSVFYYGNMNNFEAVIRFILLGYIATVFMSFMILFLSTIFKTSFKVAVISILIGMVPFVFISFSEPGYIMSCIFPIALMDPSNIFISSYININGVCIPQSWICIATVLLLTLFMYVFIKIKLRNRS